MPYAHDQPDNAARCRRLGVAEIIPRDDYTADTATKMLDRILSLDRYRTRAIEVAGIVNSEGGTIAACDAIEVLSNR
jgi:UDP:flavonoid glycosyltransferase YjiC (YdhE family)